MTEEIKLITISTTEYERLLEDSWKLNCMERAGVDNWEGMEYAMELYRNVAEGEE